MIGAAPRPDVPRIVELAEAAAYADMLRAAPAAWGCVEERTAAGWFLCNPRVDLLLFNRLLAAGLDAAIDAAAVDAAVDRFRAGGVRNYGVPLSPSVDGPEASAALHAAGLVVRDAWTKMFRGTGDLPEPGSGVRVTIAGGGEAALAARIACASFGMPPLLEPWLAALVGRDGWRHYLAWVDEEPVATAALYVRERIGWLGVAGTLAAARRRGAQSALMAARLADGVTSGCRWFVTETGQERPDRPNPSFHNMRRAGFGIVYHRPNYMARVVPS